MEFTAPQIIPVDILRQAALGQEMGVQRQMLPYQLAAVQQEQEAKGLELDKLRWALNAVRGSGLPSDSGMSPTLPPGAATGGMNVGGSSGGIQSGPQGSVAAAPALPPGAGDQPTAPTPEARIATPTAYQAPGLKTVDPAFAGAYHMLTGVDLLKGAHEQFTDAKERQKISVAPQIALARGVITSANPGPLVMNNPGLLQTWRSYAPKLGVDPTDPVQMTPDNLRAAATLYHNDVAASYGGDPLPMPHVMEQIKGQNGQLLTRDPLTGEVKQEVGPESLHSVIGSNGQPVLLPASQAVGKKPFSPSLAASDSASVEDVDWAVGYLKQTGQLPPGWSRTSMLGQRVVSRARQLGVDPSSIVVNETENAAAKKVVNDFESGATSKTLNGLNTAITHMDILEKSATALQNGDVQGLNVASNLIGKQFGSDKVTNFNIVKEFAAGEVAKAVLPGGGGEAERQQISDAIKASSSPQQLAGALSNWRQLLAGKTDSLRNQWDVGSLGRFGSFDRFLLPATKKALGISDQASSGGDGTAHPADIADLLKKHGSK